MQLEMEFFTYSFIVCLECSNPQTTPFLFSICVSRDLPKQKNRWGGILGELPNFYVPTFPWKYFFSTNWERPEEIKRELFT
jgi:hypothetical protein